MSSDQDFLRRQLATNIIQTLQNGQNGNVAFDTETSNQISNIFNIIESSYIEDDRIIFTDIDGAALGQIKVDNKADNKMDKIEKDIVSNFKELEQSFYTNNELFYSALDRKSKRQFMEQQKHLLFELKTLKLKDKSPFEFGFRDCGYYYLITQRQKPMDIFDLAGRARLILALLERFKGVIVHKSQRSPDDSDIARIINFLTETNLWTVTAVFPRHTKAASYLNGNVLINSNAEDYRSKFIEFKKENNLYGYNVKQLDYQKYSVFSEILDDKFPTCAEHYAKDAFDSENALMFFDAGYTYCVNNNCDPAKSVLDHTMIQDHFENLIDDLYMNTYTPFMQEFTKEETKRLKEKQKQRDIDERKKAELQEKLLKELMEKEYKNATKASKNPHQHFDAWTKQAFYERQMFDATFKTGVIDRMNSGNSF